MRDLHGVPGPPSVRGRGTRGGAVPEKAHRAAVSQARRRPGSAPDRLGLRRTPGRAGEQDVLEAYTRPRDPARPVVCLDELSKQRVAETRLPVPAQPGHPERVDDEYERRGTANLFLAREPLVGQRHITVTEQRTAVDFAHEVRDLLEVRYTHAEKVVLVMDNRNTHKPAPGCLHTSRCSPWRRLASFPVWCG